jgi:antitoxin component of RelBE/YafQ-DinJ toxin-antitoxin module
MYMITTLSVKIDAETKKSLKEFANELGVPVSFLVNGSIKQMLRDRSVTFSAYLEPTPYLEEIMREAEADIAAGRNIISFKNNEEAIDYLRSI